MADQDVTQITDEMLESIAGGQLDETARGLLRGIVEGCKMKGDSLEAVYEQLGSLSKYGEWDEVSKLIREYYG